MSYTAFYRKLRPKNFASVIGQEHIVRTLKNQIMNGRISHAYLFCGTRGTGKTSTAKIFAKAINCLAPQNGEACGVCAACTAIDAGYSMNVIEIDAASNNGVENIREIREEVKYPPTEGRYKVYIIDEVHMLSTGAFNALLKTLEEPPEHVIFILATTDPQKIPPTIHSRCQRFDFKRITVADMTAALAEYMAGENIAADADALKYVAGLSDGAMRDALSILDQCAAFYFDEPITLANVRDIVGSTDSAVLYELTAALDAFDSGKCLSIINELIVNGRDVSQFVSELVSHFRNLLVAANVDTASLSLDILSENIERLREQAAALNPATLIHYIHTFAALQGQLRYAQSERILLEVTCMRLCSPEAEEADATLEPRLKKIEDTLKTGVKPTAVSTVAPAKVEAISPKENESDQAFKEAFTEFGFDDIIFE